MLYNVKYTDVCRNNLKEVSEVLLKYYPSTFQKFIKDFNSKIEILRIFPYSYQKDYYSENRKIQLKYHYNMLYKIDNYKVIISEIVSSNKNNQNKN